MAVTIDDLPYVDLYSRAFLEDPEAVVAPARDQGLGMARSDRGVEALSYDAVVDFLRDTRFVFATVAKLKDSGIVDGPAFDFLVTMLLGSTPGDSGRQMHRRQRRAAAPWFTTERADQFHRFARTWIDQVLDEHLEADEFDFWQSLAQPLPPRILCQMVGAPISDGPSIMKLAYDVVQFTRGARPEAKDTIERAAVEFHGYVLDLLELRRTQPEDDMISALLEAEARDELTASEIVSIVFTVLLGGNDTTVGQICKNLATLADRPDQWRLLKREPELLPSAIDELMRFSASVMTPSIKVVDDPSGTIEFRGLDIPPNVVAHGCTFAATKDPRVFENPQELDLTRTLPLNPVVFGYPGLHSCMGRPFAMVMMEEVLQSVLVRWDEFEVDAEFSGSPYKSVPERMLVRFTANRRVGV